MTAPRVEVDLGKIRHNTRYLVQRLEARAISVIGITKAVCGHPDIAQAMLDGGAKGLGDSRIENVERMRNAGISCPVTMIRTPMLSQARRISDSCGVSYNTEIEVIASLGVIARRKGAVHGVVVMVEMGDFRDGVMPCDLDEFVTKVLGVPGVALKGIAANFACLHGVAPDCRDMTAFSALADEIERACGPQILTVSGGNSANLPWAFGPGRPGQINELRLGEAILLGVDPVSGARINGLHTDAFAVVAEVIESKDKPVRRNGPSLVIDRKTQMVAPISRRSTRSILALGYQDTDIGALRFPAGVALKGATSDHTVVETSGRPLRIGSEIKLRPNYKSLMRIMNAPDVAKVVFNRLPVPNKTSVRENRTGLDAPLRRATGFAPPPCISEA